jgi:hypothetical protein
VLALDPINRTIPMTITRTTANMIAYSATSCPSLFQQKLFRRCWMTVPYNAFFASNTNVETSLAGMAITWRYERN